MLEWSLVKNGTLRRAAAMDCRKGVRMKSPRLVLLIGFGTLLILIGWMALSAFWRAERIYSEISSIHESYRKSTSILDDI